MRLALSGAQSTGKTTLVNLIKEKYPNANIITEITRSLPKQYKINEDGDNSTQFKLLECHIKVFEDTKEGNHIIDRCMLDILCYSYYTYVQGKMTSEEFDRFYNTVQKYIDGYTIFYIKPEFDPVYDGTRSTNIEYRDAIAGYFEHFIKDLNLNVITLSGTPEERFNTFNNFIKEKQIIL